MDRTPIIAALAAIVAAGVSSPARADTWTDPPEVVPPTLPYQGTLELAGELLNAVGDDKLTVWVRIDAVDGAGNVTAAWPDPGDATVFEKHEVNVFNGRFGLAIGSDPSHPPLWQSAIFASDAGTKRLHIEVGYPMGAEAVPLGFQELASVPYALRAHRALLAKTALKLGEAAIQVETGGPLWVESTVYGVGKPAPASKTLGPAVRRACFLSESFSLTDHGFWGDGVRSSTSCLVRIDAKGSWVLEAQATCSGACAGGAAAWASCSATCITW